MLDRVMDFHGNKLFSLFSYIIITHYLQRRVKLKVLLNSARDQDLPGGWTYLEDHSGDPMMTGQSQQMRFWTRYDPQNAKGPPQGAPKAVLMWI